MTKLYVFIALTLLALVAVLVSLIVLIVRAIMKKNVKAVAIVLAVAVALTALCAFLTMREYANAAATLPLQSITEAVNNNMQTDEDGNSYFTLTFETTDRDGNTVTSDIFAENKLTLVNLWEPWCNPCVGEMPDLQRLSEDYADKGVAVVGVYSTEDGADKVLADNDITYLILHYNDDFALLAAPSAVPASVLVDSKGRIVTMNPSEEELAEISNGSTDPTILEYYRNIVLGSREYSYWADILDEYLAAN